MLFTLTCNRLFIIDGCISLPIAFAGFLIFPGLPSSSKPWWLTSTEHELARNRMLNAGVAPSTKLSWRLVKRVFLRWEFYIGVLAYTLYVCCHHAPLMLKLTFLKLLIVFLSAWANGALAERPSDQIRHLFGPANQYHSDGRSRRIDHRRLTCHVALHGLPSLGYFHHRAGHIHDC